MNVGDVKKQLLEGVNMLRSPQGYLKAGHPRYNTLFGRDSLISAWQMLKIDSSVARSTLETLAGYQGKTVNPKADEEPGKILHEFRFDEASKAELPHWDFPYYGSVDSTPLFLVLAGEYFKATKNKSFLSKIQDNVLAAFKWIEDYGDKDEDGYVEYSRMNQRGLFHQGWKDGVTDHLKITPPVAIVEVQGYVYAACQNLVFLEEALGWSHVSRRAWAKSELLKKRFNEDFWMDEEDCFALALDGEKKRRTAVTSNPGHLLFTGIVLEERLKLLASRLFQSDLWTRYGIRNHSTEDSSFDPYSYHRGSVWPHDNWIVYKGLVKLGFRHHAYKIKTALLRAFKELGKIPELYSVVGNKIVDLSNDAGASWRTRANSLQAWSSCGLLEMVWED